MLKARFRARQTELKTAQPQLNNGLVMAQGKWRVLNLETEVGFGEVNIHC
jgi:hypothetical protein